MGNRLKDLRKRKGWTQPEAAEAMAMSVGGYIKLERGENQLTTGTISRAASIFGVEASTIVSEKRIPTAPIVGMAGAGPEGAVIFMDAGRLGDAPMPPGGTANTCALEVKGTSMRGVAEDGWLIYYDAPPVPLTDDLLGSCVSSG